MSIMFEMAIACSMQWIQIVKTDIASVVLPLPTQNTLNALSNTATPSPFLHLYACLPLPLMTCPHCPHLWPGKRPLWQNDAHSVISPLTSFSKILLQTLHPPLLMHAMLVNIWGGVIGMLEVIKFTWNFVYKMNSVKKWKMYTCRDQRCLRGRWWKRWIAIKFVHLQSRSFLDASLTLILELILLINFPMCKLQIANCKFKCIQRILQRILSEVFSECGNNASYMRWGWVT